MNTNEANPTVTLICATLLLLAVVAGTIVLAWHGTVTGGEAVGVLTGVVAIAAVAFGVHKAAAAVQAVATTRASTTRGGS